MKSNTRPRVLFVEHLTLVFLLITLLVLSLNRVVLSDTTWHLKTAEIALAEDGLPGVWPTSNLFSHTNPDYPLYQQYPVYQTLIYSVYRLFGWEGLSIFHGLGWVLVFLLWLVWAGGWLWAAHFHVVWILVLIGIQQRTVLRPELITTMLLAVLLILIDGYRRGASWKTKWLSLLGIIAVQWIFANSHQMFPLGIAIQVLFLMHLTAVRFCGGRLGVSIADSELPRWPFVLTVLAASLVCGLTPLGLRVFYGPIKTFQCVALYRSDIFELSPIYEIPDAFLLSILCAILAVCGFLKVRHRWEPFELGIWLIGLLMVASAWRGIAFFALFSVAVFSRCAIAAREFAVDGSSEHRFSFLPSISRLLNSGQLGLGRMITLSVACGFCLFVIYFRAIEPIRGLIGIQPGIGRALGQWPDHSMDFLKNNPPPGEMLNLGWETGGILIWELFPEKRVFVDPRTEAYPEDFMLKAIAAPRKPEVLQDLLEHYQPQWIVGNVRLTTTQQMAANLLSSGEWHFVFADTILYVLVKDSPETKEYLSKHRISPSDINPPDLLYGEPDLLKRQLLRMASFYRHLGLRGKLAETINLLEPYAADDPSLAGEIERLSQAFRDTP